MLPLKISWFGFLMYREYYNNSLDVFSLSKNYMLYWLDHLESTIIILDPQAQSIKMLLIYNYRTNFLINLLNYNIPCLKVYS
jgi:hypothetical protein